MGLVELQDPETGAIRLVDTSSAAVRGAFAAQAAAEINELQTFFRRSGIDTLQVSTGRPYIDGVRALFKCRAMKR